MYVLCVYTDVSVLIFCDWCVCVFGLLPGCVILSLYLCTCIYLVLCLFTWVFWFLCVCVCVCVCVSMRDLTVSSRQVTQTLKCPPDSPVVLMRALQGTGVKGQWTPKLLGQVTLSPGWAQFLGSSTENH